MTRARTLFALLACALACAACTLTEVTVADTEDVVIAELTLRTDATTQRLILHRTLQGDDSAAAAVTGARIEITNGKNQLLTFVAAADRFCVDNAANSEHPPFGSCYTADTRPTRYPIVAGETYTLRITLPTGGVMTGVTHVPQDWHYVRPGVSGCTLPANDTFSIRWTASSGAWVYAAETLIRGLKPILAARGIDVDDPLRLFGLSASSSDTTIVFPTEFGIFERFDTDKADALLAIRDGLPGGTTADVTIAAADRNYVQWERGGDFNPSGSIRIPSIQGAGTGVFASLVPHAIQIRIAVPGAPGC